MNAQRLTEGTPNATDIARWLNEYSDAGPTSSNQGTSQIPFQRWFHFKEAFSPKFVTDTIASLPYKVSRCLDPFGGSGTTAITCRMLGISSTTIEVNPFLADLIEAKVSPVAPAAFCEEYERIITNLQVTDVDRKLDCGMPRTLTEPGVNDRYVFPADVYAAVRAIVRASELIEPAAQRLLKVLLGSVLVANSNVIINGKGRRYRRGWEAKQKCPNDLIDSLDCAVDRAVADLTRFSDLAPTQHKVCRGDTRAILGDVGTGDVAIFSPPYPNSFDYTDVYNLELWMLGYLTNRAENRDLRHQTLRSHVQLKWRETPRIAMSGSLTEVLDSLMKARTDLWNPHIPEMVRYYFDDLHSLFKQLRKAIPLGKHVVVAIGDSQYAGIHIDVASILVECVASIGFRLTEHGSIRSMRSSSQHGGRFDLSEHCLVFERCS